jgi:hypothetical protein
MRKVKGTAHGSALSMRHMLLNSNIVSDCDFEDFFWRALSDVEIRVLHDLQESAWLFKSLGCETPDCDAVSLDFPGVFTFWWFSLKKECSTTFPSRWSWKPKRS